MGFIKEVFDWQDGTYKHIKWGKYQIPRNKGWKHTAERKVIYLNVTKETSLGIRKWDARREERKC